MAGPSRPWPAPSRGRGVRWPEAALGRWPSTPSAAERLRLADGTPLLWGRSRTTAVRSDLTGYAGYGHDTSHHCFYWGSRLLLVTTCEGTVTSFRLANPKLYGEREHPRLLLSTRPANRSPKGSAVVTDKGLSGTEEFFAGQGLCLVRPPRADEPDGGASQLAAARIEAIIWTLKHQLGLGHLGGRILAGLWARVVQRLLASTP